LFNNIGVFTNYFEDNELWLSFSTKANHLITVISKGILKYNTEFYT